MNQVLKPIVLYSLIQLFILLLLFILIKCIRNKNLKSTDKTNAYIVAYYQTGFNLLTIIKYFALLQYRPEKITPFLFDHIAITSISIILAISSLFLKSRRLAQIIVMFGHVISLTLYQLYFFKGPTNLLWCCILCIFSFGISLVWRLFYLYDGIFELKVEDRVDYISQWNALTKELFSYAINVLIAIAATLGVALTILYNGSQNSDGGWTGIEIISESVIFIIGYCWISIGFISFIGLPYLHNKKAIMHMGNTCFVPNKYVKKYSRPLNAEEAIYENRNVSQIN
jgi:hypothetical protein